jgi:hypothetical protein
MAAAASGKVSVADLGNTLTTLGPVASKLKMPLEDVFAAITTATKSGMTAEQATGGMKAILLSMLKQSSMTKKAAGGLGVEFNKAALQSKGFAGMMEGLGKAADGSEDKLSMMFKSLDAAQMVMMLGADGGKQYKDVLAGIGVGAGKTDAAFAKVTDDTEFLTGRLKGYGDMLGVTFGASLDRLLRPLMTVAVKVSESMERMISALPPEFLDVLSGVVVGFTALVGIVGGVMLLVGAMGMLGVTIGSLVTGLLLFAVIVPATILLIGGLAVAVYSVYRAFQKNSGGVATSWEDMLKRIRLGSEGVMAILKGEKFSDALEESLGKEENRGVVKFLRGFESLVERVRFWWAGLKKGFEDGVLALSESPSMKKLTETMDNVFGLFTGAGVANSKESLDKLGASGEATGKRLAELGEIAIEAITKLVELGQVFMGFVGNMSVEELSKNINTAITSFRGMWDSLKAIVEVLGWVSRAIQLVINLIQFLGAFVAETMAFMVNSVMIGWKVISQLRTGNFKDAFATVKSGARELFTTNPYEESTKQMGDIVRIFDPESKVGDPAAVERAKQEDVSQLMRMRESAGAILVQQQRSGEDTSLIVAALGTINSSIMDLTNRPPAPQHVTIDSDQMASSQREANKRDEERGLAFEQGMVF